jgi:hypothetical protein
VMLKMSLWSLSVAGPVLTILTETFKLVVSDAGNAVLDVSRCGPTVLTMFDTHNGIDAFGC